MPFLAWIAMAAGVWLIYAARKGTSPVDTLRAILAGEPPPAPAFPIEGLGEQSAMSGVGAAIGSAAGEVAAGQGAGGVLLRPVAGAITSPFGMRGGRMHQGVDIPMPQGTPVRAAAGGEVSGTGYEPLGAGNYVKIKHPNGWVTKYFHLSAHAVRSGQTVAQGTTVGYVGSTGDSSGPHLHFEVWIDGVAKNPAPYIGG